MKKTKRFLAILFAAVLTFSLAGCGDGDTPPDKKQTDQHDEESKKGDKSSAKKEMNVAISIDAGSLNPYDRLENIGRQTWAPVYESLFAYGDDLTPVPVLVDNYEFSDDHRVLTLHLKKGIKFHNGQELKANDVVFTFTKVMKKTSSYHMGDVNWDGIRAEDDYTVVIPFNSVEGAALYYLCNVYVLCESYMTAIPENEWASDCIGTGPYMWGNVIFGSEYELLRFEDYRDKKYLDKIKIRIIPDPEVQKIAVKSGDIDIACGLQFPELASFKNDEQDNIDVFAGQPIALMEIVFNFKNPKNPLHDLRVREAVIHSLDIETINKVVFAGLGTPATAIYPSGVPAYKRADNLREYSPEKAKQLLADAGYSNGVTIDLFAQNTSVFQTLADVLVGMCAQSGITLNIIPCDFSSFEGYFNGGENPGIYAYRQYCNGDPYILINKFFSEASVSYGKCGYTDDEFFKDLSSARDEAFDLVSQNARNDAYHKLMQVVYDRLYYASIIEYSDNIALSSAVQGFHMSGPIYHYEDCYFK